MNNGLLSNNPVPRTKTYNFYENGLFRKPSWAKWFLVKLIAGGGGGGSGSFGPAQGTIYTPLGGGGGGFSEYLFHESEVPVEVDIAIGQGGAGAPASSSTANSPIVSGTNGTVGGNTSFGAMLRAEGGRGGLGTPWPPLGVNAVSPDAGKAVSPRPAATNQAAYYTTVDYMPPAKGLQHGCENNAGTRSTNSSELSIIEALTKNFDCGGGSGGHGGSGDSLQNNGYAGVVGAGRASSPTGGSGGAGSGSESGTPASGSAGTASTLLPYGGGGGGGGGSKGAANKTTNPSGAGGAGGFPGGGGGASGNNHAPTYAGGVGAGGNGANGMAQVIAYSEYPMFGSTFSGIPTNTKGKIESFVFSAPGLSQFRKPAWATSLMVVCVHSGSGGNSGSRGFDTPYRTSGGLGGNGGGITTLHLAADTVANEVPVFVGTGGAGGLGVSVNGVGTVGLSGQDSYFDGYTFKGSRGQYSAGTATSATPVDSGSYGTMGGSEPTLATAPGSGTGTLAYNQSPLTYSMVPAAGGNGGSTFTTNTGFFIGQTGGSVDIPVALSGGTGASPASTPSNGQDGASLTLTYNNDPRVPDFICGGAGGGGGGVSTDSSPSSNGGAGGWPGGGGGGGGAIRYNAGTSGAGGKGGNALIVVICYGE